MRTIVRCPIVPLGLDLPIMDIKKEFGKKIKVFRLEKGISQEELASIADIDRTYISDIEKGDRNVSLIVISKISKAFEISISELLEGI